MSKAAENFSEILSPLDDVDGVQNAFNLKPAVVSALIRIPLGREKKSALRDVCRYEGTRML